MKQVTAYVNIHVPMAKAPLSKYSLNVEDFPFRPNEGLWVKSDSQTGKFYSRQSVNVKKINWIRCEN